MSVFKRGEVYWYEFRFKGIRVRESTGMTNKTAAMRMEALKRAELLRGRGLVAAPPFDQFVQGDFLPWSLVQHQAHPNTHKRYRVSSKPLVHFFGRMKLDEITAGSIEQFKLKRLNQCSPAGVNRDLAALRFMLNYAVRKGFISGNPFADVKLLQESGGNMRIVSHEEEGRYLQHASPLLKDIAILMVETGMRPNEVFAIRRENVHANERYIFIPAGKTRFARRNVLLTDRALEVIQRRLTDITGNCLFPHRTDLERPMIICRGHHSLVKRLGFNFRLYDFRHTFGSRMAMAGVDLPTLKELMGHSSITLTMRYVHPTPEHKRDAFRKLELFNQGPHKSPHTARMGAA